MSYKNNDGKNVVSGSARARPQGHQQVVILLSMVMLCYQAMETGPFGRHGSFTYYSTPQPKIWRYETGLVVFPTRDFESTTWFLHDLFSDDHPNWEMNQHSVFLMYIGFYYLPSL